MKLLLPAFAALGFLVTPASEGVTPCRHLVPGHCKLHCGSLERPVFMCDRYKQCCVKNPVIPKPFLPPPVRKSKSPCKIIPKSQNKKQRKLITPKLQ